MNWQNDEKIDRYVFAFLGLRALIDLGVAAAIWKESETFVIGIGCFFASSVITLILVVGLIRGFLPGRYGIRIYRDAEPTAYWVGFIIASIIHLLITVLYLYNIDWKKIFPGLF